MNLDSMGQFHSWGLNQGMGLTPVCYLWFVTRFELYRYLGVVGTVGVGGIVVYKIPRTSLTEIPVPPIELQ